MYLFIGYWSTELVRVIIDLKHEITISIYTLNFLFKNIVYVRQEFENEQFSITIAVVFRFKHRWLSLFKIHQLSLKQFKSIVV